MFMIWRNAQRDLVKQLLISQERFHKTQLRIESSINSWGAATSVGANYVEADDAVSKKEFLKSIGTCKKETREVKHFLRMAVRAVPELKPKARSLWLEARELHLIFSKIWRNGKNES